MKKIELKTLKDLQSFYKSNEKYKLNHHCLRNGDSYSLSIEAFTERSDNEAMLIHKTTQAECDITIHIDSEQFLDAYNKLTENEKLQIAEISDNPILGHPKMSDVYMCYFVECNCEKILDNLKQYSEMEDNYTNIAKLVFTTRGRVFGKMNGI